MKNSKIQLLSEPEEFEWDKTHWDMELSFLDLVEEDEQFVATADRLPLGSLLTMIEKILVANGFVSNLENILAALENLRVSHRAKTEGKVVKGHLPALTFKLPKKNHKGRLLGLYYDELSQYAYEIHSLKIKHAAPKSQSEALENELSRNQSYMASLEARIKELNEKLKHFEQGGGGIGTIGGDVLPPDLRMGTISKINLSDRHTIIHFERGNLKVPLSIFVNTPIKDAGAIIAMQNGRPTYAINYANKAPPLKKGLAEVLVAEHDHLKLRDRERKEYILEAVSEQERADLHLLKPKNLVVVTYLEGQIIGFQSLKDVDPHQFSDFVQREIVSHQLREQRLKEEENSPLDDEKGDQNWTA